MRTVRLVFWLTLLGIGLANAATEWHTDPFGPAQITTSDGFDISSWPRWPRR